MKPVVICRVPNHIGDCCMTLPALRLLEASGFEPYLVGKRFTENLMVGMGWKFQAIEGKLFKDGQVLGALAQSQNKPLGLLFPNSFSSALQFKLAGIRAAGLDTDCRSIILDKAIPEPAKMHEVERFFQVALGAIKAWGKEPAFTECPKELGLRVTAEHAADAKALKEKYNIPEKYALLAPITKGIHNGQIKHWKDINEVCKPLRDMGIEPIVLPAPDEIEVAKTACPDATHLPPTKLGTYAALCQDAQIVIANDSGISHIAAAAGAKQLTLIGVTRTDRTGPWNPKALTRGEEGRWPTVDEVIEAIKEIVNNE